MATLREHERGTVAIEVAYRHKLILIPTSTSIDVRTLEQGLDKEQTELVVQTLRRRKKDILRITSSPDTTRETLSEAQRALSDAWNEGNYNLDMWDRLEKAYRLVFPDDSRCIHGDKGCPEDALVLCSACEKPKTGKGTGHGD